MQRPALKFVQGSAGIFMGFSVSLLSAQARPHPSITPDAVAKRLSGLLVYQLEGDRQIHMTTCLVTKEDRPKVDTSSELYLYQEQARDDRLGATLPSTIFEPQGDRSQSGCLSVLPSS